MTTVAPPAPPPPARSPVVEETLVQVAGYAGAVAAIVAIVVIVGRSANVSPGEIEAVAGAIAAALLGAGFVVRRDSPDTYQRMRSVFWVGSFYAFTLFMATAVAGGGDVSSFRSLAITIELTSGIYAVVLYALHRHLLQQVLAFQAALGFVAALTFPDPSGFFFGPPDLTAMALLFWLVSGAWFLLGYRGILRPRRTALVLGALGLLFSPLLFTTDRTIAEILVLGSACGLIAVARLVDDWAVAAIGISGVLFGAGEVTRRHFTSTDGSLVAAFAAGLVLFVGAIVMIVVSKPAAPPPPPETPPEPSP